MSKFKVNVDVVFELESGCKYDADKAITDLLWEEMVSNSSIIQYLKDYNIVSIEKA